MKILIQGGRIINPASGLDTAADMAIANGRILAIGSTPPDFTPDTTLNARGCPARTEVFAFFPRISSLRDLRASA